MVHGKDMTPTWVVSSSLKIPEPKDLSLEKSEDPCVSERRQREWSAQCDVHLPRLILPGASPCILTPILPNSTDD
jgi:hypothetical protein